MTHLEALRLKPGTSVVVTCYKPNRRLTGTVFAVGHSPYTNELQVIVILDNPPKGFNRVWAVTPKWVELEAKCTAS